MSVDDPLFLKYLCNAYRPLGGRVEDRTAILLSSWHGVVVEASGGEWPEPTKLIPCTRMLTAPKVQSPQRGSLGNHCDRRRNSPKRRYRVRSGEFRQLQVEGNPSYVGNVTSAQQPLARGNRFAPNRQVGVRISQPILDRYRMQFLMQNRQHAFEAR